MKKIKWVLVLAFFCTFLSLPTFSKEIILKHTTPLPLTESDLNKGIPFEEWSHGHLLSHRDYGESWFCCGVTEDNGVVFGLITCSNYGLKKNEISSDFWFYPSPEKQFYGHGAYSKDEFILMQDKFGAHFGPNIFSATENEFKFTFQDENHKMELVLKSNHSSSPIGGSHMKFLKDGKEVDDPPGRKVTNYCASGILSGTFESNREIHQFTGSGYFDHALSTVKIPDYSNEWHSLTAPHKDYGLKILLVYTKKGYKPEITPIFYLVKDGVILANDDQVEAIGSEYIKDEKSGYEYPSSWEISRDFNGIKLTGTMKKSTHLDSINILGNYPWIVRKMVQVFYTKPYHIHFLMDYDFELDVHGEKIHLKDTGIGEVHIYR